MSDTISLGFKLTGEADFKRALTDINNQLKLNASEMALVSAKYDENGKSVEALTAKNKVLQSSLENEQKNITALKSAIENSTSAHAQAGAQIEKIKISLSEAKTKMEEMGKAAGTTKEDLLKQQNTVKDLNKELKDAEKAYVSTGTNTTKWGTQLNDAEAKVISLNKQLSENEKALKKVDASTKSFSGKMTDLGNKITDTDEKLGGKLSKSVEAFGVAAVAAGALAVKSFVDFSKQMVKVGTLLDENVLSYNDAQKSVLSWSTQSVQSADSVAEAMYDALSSGVQTADVQRFMAQASQTATAGFTDVGASVDILTTILNSYGLKATDVTAVSDKLLLTQDRGKVTVGQLSDGLGNLVGIAANAGVSLNETLSAIAALTAGGLPASSAINSVKSAISNIIKPTAEAEVLAKKLHIAFNAQALESKGLSGVLESVKSATGGSAEKMAVLFGSVEALNAVMSLAGEQNKTFKNTLSGMNDTAGKTQQVFDKISNDSGYKFNQSVISMQNSLINLGIALTPLINALSGLFSVLGGIPAPVLIIIGTLFSVAAIILQVIKATTVLGGLGGAVGTFFGGFNVGAMKTVAIILAVVAALIALAAIIAVIIGKSSELNSTMANVGTSVNQVKSTVSTAGNGVTTQRSVSSSIPKYALGTSNHPGGPAIINDGNGYPGEIVDLPSGSRVYPHGTKPSGGDTYYVTIDAKSIKEFEDISKMAKQKRQLSIQGAS